MTENGNKKDNADIHCLNKVKGLDPGKVEGHRDEQFNSSSSVQDIIVTESHSNKSRTEQSELQGNSFQNANSCNEVVERTQDISVAKNEVHSPIVAKSAISLCDYTSSSSDSD